MSARTWLKLQRYKQAQAIQEWKPWKLSTGPRTKEGKETVSRNAWKGGLGSEDRELIKITNKTLRNQRKMLGDLAKNFHHG